MTNAAAIDATRRRLIRWKKYAVVMVKFLVKRRHYYNFVMIGKTIF
jgi:hypothetical protein